MKGRWRTKGVPTRFCSSRCVPRDLRAKGGRKGRLQAALRGRLARHRGHLRRLQALGRITGEDLLATFATISHEEYSRGYGAAEAKWLWRQQQRRQGKGEAA